jgi:hypothetical protein
MAITDPLIQWIRVALVFLALAAFAILFASAMYQVWAAPTGKPPQYNDPYLYVATGLAALVGGIFAVAFGARTASGAGATTPVPAVAPAPAAAPAAPPAPAAPDGGSAGPARMPALVGSNLSSLGSVPALSDDMQAILGGVYALVYVIVGIAALTTWVFHPNEISDLVKNLGTTFLGLALPIVTAFFRPPS